ncbi:MAG TPA: NAD(P)/FAD-dependent oxidoreductase [Pseudonocardia sp.]|jgi:cyclohexanone monooxygenase|nr:NAD(P)/FAD-dependent oxidoreductase [Pseudonocardia sp.]
MDRSPDAWVEILIVGAGPAGIGTGIKLKEAGFDSFVILEKASDVGGTWRDATYPGLTVDIPVLTYSFSYEQKPDWSSLWAPQRELLTYLRHCTQKYGLRPHLRFDREVVDARYDEERNVWITRTGDGSEFRSRYLINASGFLSVPKWPDLEGLDEFEGRRLHTSAWTDDLDLRGDRIGFIGTGATGIQLAPELAPGAAALHVFQRTPIWLLPKVPLPVPRAVQRLFALVPGAQRLARLLTAAFMDLVFWRAFTDYGQVRLMGAAVEKLARRHIRTQVDDPAVAEALTPRYSWGCKRPSFSNRFYPIFNRENVELVTEPIERLTRKGIVTRDGTERPIDTLICATGYRPFEKAALPTYPVAGRNGQQLADYWDINRYQAFRGFAVHGFPNYFMVFGPYSIASTSYFAMIELQVRNIVRVLRAARDDDATYVEVREQAQAADLETTLRRKKKSIWSVADCGSSNSFYFDRFGDTPGFRPTYHPAEWWAARTLSASHFHLEKRDEKVRT